MQIPATITLGLVTAATLAVVAGAATATPLCDPPEKGSMTVKLRAVGGVVMAELVHDGDVVHELQAAEIQVCDAGGNLTGEVQVVANGLLRIAPVVDVEAPKVQIGVTVEAVPEPVAAQLEIDTAQAVLVTAVTEELPAHRAGLEAYDVITHIDGTAPVTQETLSTRIAACSAGEPLAFRVLRRGEPLDLRIIAEPYRRRRPVSSPIGDLWWLDRSAERTLPPAAMIEAIEAWYAPLPYGPVIVHPSATEPADDPLARLRAELESLKAQIETIERLLGEVEAERTDD